MTAAITNPDNIANFILKSHKTAASAARLAGYLKSQAVTQSADKPGPSINNNSSQKQAASGPPPTTSGDEDSNNDSNEESGDSDDSEVINNLKHTPVKGMYYLWFIKTFELIDHGELQNGVQMLTMMG